MQDIVWDGDGFTFSFSHIRLRQYGAIHIRVLCEDGTYLAYTECEVPTQIASTLEQTLERTSGMSLETMLGDLTSQLRLAADGNRAHNEVELTDSDAWSPEDAMSDSASDDLDFEYGDGLDDDAFFGAPYTIQPRGSTDTEYSGPAVSLARVRQDIEALRLGGFLAGIVRGFTDFSVDNIMSASVRVEKLHLPLDTMEAWGLRCEDYVVLLIRYTGYTTFEQANERPAKATQMQFRLRKCSTHKPSEEQALSAFAKNNEQNDPGKDKDGPGEVKGEASSTQLSQLCVGESIDNLMDNEFISILRIRSRQYQNNHDGWTSAKADIRTIFTGPSRPLPESPPPALPTEASAEVLGPRSDLPLFLQDDHIDERGQRSLALVAAQFAFRHFVDCTKFCLICQHKLDSDFESLKPYVCGRPLCLYQYMTLGFAPNVEHEIVHQPYVVDLLITFCYQSLMEDSAGQIGMREYPTGLALKVARIRKRPSVVPSAVDPLRYPYAPADTASSPLATTVRSTPYGDLIDPENATFYQSSSKLVLLEYADATKYKRGQIIAVAAEDPLREKTWLHHARIEGLYMYEIMVQVITTQEMQGRGFSKDDVNPTTSEDGGLAASIILCDDNIDELNPSNQRHAMLNLLATLPSVAEMRLHLLSTPDGQLVNWNKMVPSALSLLRWILASNRSCIMQVGSINRISGTETDKKVAQEAAGDPRYIPGLDNYVQFRFAQGSPDHEVRFQSALRQVTKPQKSLLAWHGSPLRNWHSIIREGLDFKKVLNGRAYGNGVYFGKDLGTSLGYSQRIFATSAPLEQCRTKSLLNIQQTVSLVELVNMPEQFQSTAPYFVVQKCDWIQCRYLFVQTAITEAHYATDREVIAGLSIIPHRRSTSSSDQKFEDRKDEFVQDPSHRIQGLGQIPLFIPRLAIETVSSLSQKADILLRRKTERGHLLDATPELDPMDQQLFGTTLKRERDAELGSPDSGSKRSRTESITVSEDGLVTSFEAGRLDFSTLVLLEPPSYATTVGSQTLGRELKRLQKLQETTPSRTLGWYIDFDRMTNMYQWIIELHSFDQELPLARDMDKAGLQSIVLEMRFGRDFPLSPPFVRVVRPRFLPFMEGGGGHVTAGGAMCMELLTNTGWSPASSLESVLLQVRLAICSTDPKPARLQGMGARVLQTDYGVSDAFDAYQRAALRHGWTVPKDFIEAFARN